MQRLYPLEIISAAYRDVLTNWRGLLRVGALWVVVLNAIRMTATLSGFESTPGAWFLSVIEMVVWAAIAVMWHRHLILGKDLDGAFAPVNGGVFRYLGAQIVMYVVIGLVALISMLPAIGGNTVIGVVTGGIAFVAVVAIMARLSVWFPAIAVNDRSVGWRRSIEVTRGHTLAIAFGGFLVALPVGLVSIVLLYPLSQLDGIAAPFLSFVISVAATLVSIAVAVAFLSFTYMRLVPRPTNNAVPTT